MTQEELGKQMAKQRSKNQVTQWETGFRKPNPSTLREMAQVLKVSIEWLHHGGDSRELLNSERGDAVIEGSSKERRARVAELLEIIRKGLEASERDGHSKAFGEALGLIHGHKMTGGLGYYLKDDSGQAESLKIIQILDEARKHPDPGVRIIADRIWFNSPAPFDAF